jgi:hypothetical protein
LSGPLPFWERFPSEFRERGGASIFSSTAFVTEEHDQWLPERKFPVVAYMSRNPRYTNKRTMDPQMKCFADELHEHIGGKWNLPVPNQAAAYKSLAKYGKSMPLMDSQQVIDMNRAWTWTVNHFSPYMANSRILTYEEAKSRFDMSTSSGAPFNVMYPKKSELFEKYPDIDQWLQSDWETLAKDPNWTCLCTNSLKEELRLEEKIAKNSIRTFTAMAIDATTHGTRLFADMNEKMYASHLRSSSAVGMSPLKGGWDRLYRKLNVYPNGYAIDESEYDSSLRAYMMWGCADMRWKMLRQEDQTPANFQRIKTYYRNLVNTVIITPTGVLIMKKDGNPSGSTNTITDNTFILYALLAYAWIRTSTKAGLKLDQADFDNETRLALNGDDNTWTVSDYAHEFFNGSSVIEEWKTIGITSTTDSLEPRKAIDLDFLSARTVILKGMAVPCYERAKLMTSLLYAPAEHLTPATTLERLTGLLCIGWVDVKFRTFCRELIAWLIAKYDYVLQDDHRWRTAKNSVKTDLQYEKLFFGQRKSCVVLKPQSIHRSVERSEMRWKSEMSAPQGRRKVKRGKKKPQRAPAKIVVVARRKPNRRRRTRMGAPKERAQMGRGGPFPTLQMGTICNQPSKLGSGRVESGDEDIGTISATSTSFVCTQYSVNPANATTFPWLSKIASLYEMYEFDYLEFYTISRTGEYNALGSIGALMMSIDFDAADAPPASSQQVLDTEPHVEALPAYNLCLKMNKQMLDTTFAKRRFCRIGNLPGGADIKTYDLGNLNFCTEGLGASSGVLCTLHVRYRIRLYKRVLENVATAPANNQVSQFEQTGNVSGVGATGVKTIQPVATVLTNGLNVVNTAGSLVPPVGNYIIDVWHNSDNGANGITETTLSIYVNGGLYVPTMVTQTNGSSNSLSVGTFVACNGTTAITILVADYYTVNALTHQTIVRITAV